MYENIALLRLSSDMARHAGMRQAVVARNIANADTPGYRAAAIAPFNEVYSGENGLQMRAERAGHISSSSANLVHERDASSSAASPNSNDVSLELEMLHAINVEREHNRALSIYRHSLTVLRAAISGR